VKVLALTAVNLNTKYVSCVPYFIEFWLSLKTTTPGVSFVPKVLVMAEELPESLHKYSRWCEVFYLNREISSTFSSQAVRILQPSLEEADYVLTTDVDMLPMSDRVFEKAINALNLGAEFVVCRDVLPVGQYPVCYNIAAPKVWARINGTRTQFDVVQKLQTWFESLKAGYSYAGEHGGAGWFTDQERLFELVNEFENEGGKVTKLKDRDTGHRRLDRLFMPFPINWIILPAIKNRYFTDYHVHHPVANYRKYLRAVLRMRDGS
jgi:hypothetical protein